MTNPATGAITGHVALAGVPDARHVIGAATAAFPRWRETSLTKRTAILFRFGELLNERKEELAAIITTEHGKVRSDALGEISRGQEVVEFACGIAHLLKGGLSENASTSVDVSSLRQRLGPVAIISPFNFPAMVPMWFFPIAIAAGNTVVLKPSEKDPSASLWLAKLWAEAGLPDGVFNVLQGGKDAVDELLTNPDVKAVSFVGSTPIALTCISGIVFPYCSEVYPTAIRATGAGLASTAGNAGGLTAPVVIGLAFGSIGFVGVFAVMAALLAVGALVIRLFGPRVTGKTLEQVFADETARTATPSTLEGSAS